MLTALGLADRSDTAQARALGAALFTTANTDAYAARDLLASRHANRLLTRVLQGVVAEPEDAQRRLVPHGQFVVKGREPLGLRSLMAVGRVVAGDEVIGVSAGQHPRLEGEVLVGAEVIDPQLVRERHEPVDPDEPGVWP